MFFRFLPQDLTREATSNRVIMAPRSPRAQNGYTYEPSYTVRASAPEYLLLNPDTDTPYFDKRTDREVTRAVNRATSAWNPVTKYMETKLGRVRGPGFGANSSKDDHSLAQTRSRDYLPRTGGDPHCPYSACQFKSNWPCWQLILTINILWQDLPRHTYNQLPCS